MEIPDNNFEENGGIFLNKGIPIECNIYILYISCDTNTESDRLLALLRPTAYTFKNAVAKNLTGGTSSKEP